MSQFNFFRANDLNEAISLISKFQDKNIQILAGGTDFVPKWRDEIISPEIVVEVFNIAELKEISERDGKIFVGGAVTFNEIINSELLNNKAPVLVEAAKQVGSPQIRSRATIGGNIANASPAGDSIPALFVLEAKVNIISNSEEKTVPINEFFLGPGKSILNKSELIKGFIFSPMEQSYKYKFIKLGQRSSLAISKIMGAAVWMVVNGIITEIKIAFGAVAPTVVRARKTEDFLIGKILEEKAINEAIEIVKEEIKPITDIRSNEEYRREASGILLKRMFLK